MTARQYLAQELRHALAAGEDVDGLVDRVIEVGWVPPQALDLHCDRLVGLLDNGKHIPIEVHHAWTENLEVDHSR